MRAPVLLDEAAEGVDLRSDGNAGHMIAWVREGRLERPGTGLWIKHLVEILVDTMLCVARDRVNLPLTFNHGMFAGRDRHPWLLHPFAWIGRLRRNARHVALLLDGLGDVGDCLVVQTEKERKFLFCWHG